jgi:hypothetical protein
MEGRIWGGGRRRLVVCDLLSAIQGGGSELVSEWVEKREVDHGWRDVSEWDVIVVIQAIGI